MMMMIVRCGVVNGAVLLRRVTIDNPADLVALGTPMAAIRIALSLRTPTAAIRVLKLNLDGALPSRWW